MTNSDSTISQGCRGAKAGYDDWVQSSRCDATMQ